ncbi:hypothetical protein ABC195_09405 [Microbacterium sp. 2P01SA-2]|uniref:hypothetical protein n=1 Tax=unclassified Microbacterium TaxID=2609290 RepID=UPI0039A0367B
MTTNGPRIVDKPKTTSAVVTMCNKLSTLIDAAAPLIHRADEARLPSTSEQLRRIVGQLDVMRTVLVAEGESHLDMARAYLDVCDGRIVAHAIYIGEAHRARA